MASNWRVVSQRQTEKLTPGGTFESTVDITFELTDGTRGTVSIPSRMYNESYAREQIATKADTMAAIGRLEG